MRTLFRVSTEDEFGMCITQEDRFQTLEEAEKEAKECIDKWGQSGQYFWAEPYDVIQEEPKEQRTYAHPNSIDGWEDIYPSEY